jgi:hypothetical protein
MLVSVNSQSINNKKSRRSVLNHFLSSEIKSQQIVSVIIRKRGSRRRYLSVHFPLMDSRGAFVHYDRRQLPDRRKQLHDINDLKTILSKIYND